MPRAATCLAVAALLLAAGCGQGSEKKSGRVVEATTTTADVPDARRDYVEAADDACRAVAERLAGEDGTFGGAADGPEELVRFAREVAGPALAEIAQRLRDLDPPPDADRDEASAIIDGIEAAGRQFVDDPQLAVRDPNRSNLDGVTARARRFGMLVCPLG